MNNSEFYNILASNYDVMIDFDASLKNKVEYLKGFIEPEYKEGLDLGCGTGADSITLSKLGLKVDSYDHSFEMITKARSNARHHGVKINFSKKNLADVNLREGKYDLIVSLGNTLANLSSNELEILFSKLKEAIKRNGRILIQIINYEKLPKSGNHILRKFENNKISIIRKYELSDNEINFIIEINDKKNNLMKSLTTQIFPHSVEFLSQLAEQNNLNYETFGNLQKELYSKEKSENIVMVLSK